ncbi:hypothetical protein GGQ67_001715 [Rhizobium metallidurans]|uniref:Uncharacterized protein n=2 Tax=Rhizobium/Agrobacterium group TaxID=227290 RepID=A0A7W6GBX9_9HYPH|nr:hypothetical protein [Rhizobium metallidurans]
MDREFVSVKCFERIFTHCNALQPKDDARHIAISDYCDIVFRVWFRLRRSTLPNRGASAFMTAKYAKRDTGRSGSRENIAFIRQMLAELRQVAEKEKADMLCYLIEMAYVEAGDLHARM